MADTVVVFSLSPAREQAFWALVDRLGVEGQVASVLTLLKRTVEGGRYLASHAEGFGAATELLHHHRFGESIQFLRRAPAGRQYEVGRGMGASSGSPQDVAAGVV